jgi:hypothetical protein
MTDSEGKITKDRGKEEEEEEKQPMGRRGAGRTLSQWIVSSTENFFYW